MQNLCSVSMVYIASALLYCVGYCVAAFQVKLGASDLNCVDVPLNPTHSLYVIDGNFYDDFRAVWRRVSTYVLQLCVDLKDL